MERLDIQVGRCAPLRVKIYRPSVHHRPLPRSPAPQLLEPQFAHVRALAAYVSHYEKFARYRRFARPPRRHEPLAGDAAPALLHAWLERKLARSSATPPLPDPDPYSSLPSDVRAAVRARAVVWWRWAASAVRFDIRRKAGPALASFRDTARLSALRDRCATLFCSSHWLPSISAAPLSSAVM